MGGGKGRETTGRVATTPAPSVTIVVQAAAILHGLDSSLAVPAGWMHRLTRMEGLVQMERAGGAGKG